MKFVAPHRFFASRFFASLRMTVTPHRFFASLRMTAASLRMTPSVILRNAPSVILRNAPSVILRNAPSVILRNAVTKDLLLLTLLLLVGQGSAWAAVVGGYCGDSSQGNGEYVAWEYDTGTKELTIKCIYGQTQGMADYDSSNLPPWNSYKADIAAIHISMGVERIGNDAFRGCTFLNSIVLPTSVREIGQNAFRGCSALTVVYLQMEVFPTLNEGCFADTSDALVFVVPDERYSNHYYNPRCADYRDKLRKGYAVHTSSTIVASTSQNGQLAQEGENVTLSGGTQHYNIYSYDNDDPFETSLGTGAAGFCWGIMLPAGSYSGNKLSAVAAYDSSEMSIGTLTIYNDGDTAPAGAPVGNMKVSFTRSKSFVMFVFTEPVVVKPDKNIWVVFKNISGEDYPASISACKSYSGDANGRWASVDGSEWMDIKDEGFNNTFMIHAYIEDPTDDYVFEGYSVKDSSGNDVTVSCSTFTMPAADVTVMAKFTVPLTAHKGTVSGVTGYWATFYHGSLNYRLPAGAQAFTMDTDYNLYRVGTDGSIIPAGQAVVIIAEASALTGATAESGTLTLTPTTSTADIHGTNILYGSDSRVTLTAGNVPVPGSNPVTCGKPYVLGVVNSVLGFHKFLGVSIPANKAYYVE